MDRHIAVDELMEKAEEYADLATAYLTAGYTSPDQAMRRGRPGPETLEMGREFLLAHFLFPEFKPEAITNLCRLRWYRWFHLRLELTAKQNLPPSEELDAARAREYNEAEFTALTEQYASAFSGRVSGPTQLQCEIFRKFYSIEKED